MLAKRYHRYTPEQCAWLVANRPQMRLPELTQAFNQAFSTNLKTGRLHDKCLNIGVVNPHQYKQGMQPWNKGVKTGVSGSTSFKPGQQPWRVNPVGSVRKDAAGFLTIKVKEGTHHYKKLHRVIWEQNFGPLTIDDVIVLVDCNKENLELSNMEKITRREMMALAIHEDFGPHNHPDINRATIAMVRLDIAAKLKREKSA